MISCKQNEHGFMLKIHFPLLYFIKIQNNHKTEPILIKYLHAHIVTYQ